MNPRLQTALTRLASALPGRRPDLVAARVYLGMARDDGLDPREVYDLVVAARPAEWPSAPEYHEVAPA